MGLVYIVVTMIVSTFNFMEYFIVFIYIFLDNHCIYLIKDIL